MDKVSNLTLKGRSFLPHCPVVPKSRGRSSTGTTCLPGPEVTEPGLCKYRLMMEQDVTSPNLA